MVCVQDNLLKKLQDSFVGFLVDEKDVVKVNEGLVMEGYGWITATFMGGNMVLLSSKTSQSIKEAVEAKLRWWEGWFRSILEWSPDLFSDRRSVWLRCRGIPLHAWDEQLFRMIADSFGSFIELDPSTANRSKLDFARVKISSSKMEFIDKVLNILVMEKEYQVWVVEEADGEEVVSCRGRRCVGAWQSTASSVASAAEREALVIGEALSDGEGEDGDVAEVGTERVDLVREGRIGQFDDTRKELGINTVVSENFMGQLGNAQVVGDQVNTAATSIRETCDGGQSQDALGGSLDIAPDVDKWQREETVQECVEVRRECDDVEVVPRVTDNLNLDLTRVSAGCDDVESGPISVGPNSFGPLGNLNPDMDVGADIIEGSVLRPENMGLDVGKHVCGAQYEGVGGVVVQLQARTSNSNQKEDGVTVTEKQVAKSDSGNECVDGRKAKKKGKKGQIGMPPGMPKCLQFVDAVQGGKRGGRRRRRKKDELQQKGVVEHSEDSISNSEFSCHSSSNSYVSGKGVLLPQTGVGGSAESSSNGGEASRKLLEARKIVDIQEGLGFCFSGSPIIEAQRGVLMEDADRIKIDDWEKKCAQ
ncbi:hypothetical protein P8452_74729 [Trifolium repens]|nr:hypothetical protein P8452_74729 [Trifolium repens]